MQFSIPFNRPPQTGKEEKYVIDAINSDKLSGDGKYSQLCQSWFEDKLSCKKTLLTPSCTHALEMAAMLINIGPGDEVIMPSYTFVSTANAFALRGAKVVFVDIRPDTMNIDEYLIEAAITNNTKAIVPVHYAGVSCNMCVINKVAERYGLYVIEDAAQGMMSTYQNKPVGTKGHLAAYSFHETKNFTSGGEGGLLIINDDKFIQRAEIIREKGTNRSQFFRGLVDKYTWVDVGSSYLPCELQAAYLWAQLEDAAAITSDRRKSWMDYYDSLGSLVDRGLVELPVVPENCEHNGHMFYLKCRDIEQRTKLLDYLKKNGVLAVFHYVPLHSAPAGCKYSKFHGVDRFTTKESERLVRLPLWYGMGEDVRNKVISYVLSFFVRE